MKERLLNWLCDFIIPLDILGDDEIEKVSLLGERAIQWEDLDIQIGLDDLLMSVQLRENWLNSLT